MSVTKQSRNIRNISELVNELERLNKIRQTIITTGEPGDSVKKAMVEVSEAINRFANKLPIEVNREGEE